MRFPHVKGKICEVRHLVTFTRFDRAFRRLVPAYYMLYVFRFSEHNI
jgi:hypothetical protein